MSQVTGHRPLGSGRPPAEPAGGTDGGGDVPGTVGARAVAAAGEVTVDLESQTVAAGDRTFRFDIDADIKDRLLNGLDDIGQTLQHTPQIDAYEAKQPSWMPAIRVTSSR